MSHSNFKAQTPKKERPKIKNNVNFTEHIKSFVGAFTKQQKEKKQIVQAYLNKRDRPLSIVELPLYNFSKLTLSLLHLVSFLFAVSFVYYLQTLALATPIFYALSFISVALLAFSEFGQHSTLNTLFNIKFLSGVYSQRLTAFAFVFSLISVTSSSVGIAHFFSSVGVESNILYYALVSASLLVEFFILANTYDIHRFENTAKNEVNMLNDMYHQNGTASIFIDQKPPLFAPTNFVDTTPTIAIADKAEKIIKPLKSKTHKTGKNLVSTYVLEPLSPPKVGASTDAKVWSNSDIKGFLRLYRDRVGKQKKAGRKITDANKVGLWFFTSIQNRKTYKANSVADRKALYQNAHTTNSKTPKTPKI